MAKTILVIAPHADDEVLGCGGYMIKEIEKGAKVYVLFGTIGGSDVRQPIDERKSEVEKVAKACGFDYGVIAYNYDAMMDKIEDKKIIGVIDKAIADLKPDEVLVNYPSRHQDHKKMYECCMAAMRLKEGFMPPFFALYEYPFITNMEVPNGGLFYYNIEDVLDRKVSLFGLYKTQVKASPSPLNEEGIRSIARMRGMESGVKYAEMFYIQKLVK